MDPLVCCVGDLVEDIVVRLTVPAQAGTDVPASVTRHRGGSAANTAAVVARLGGRARFVGQVGADERGDRLVRDLRALGVECVGPRGGETGTVVVVVDPNGERTMFSDRRASAQLATYDEHWIDGVAALHVPYYSLAGATASAAVQALLDAGRRRGVLVSLDPSSETLAGAGFRELVRDLKPDVVFCNAAEAAALGVDDAGLDGARLVFVKRGGAPVSVCGEVSATVPAPPVAGTLDTTGAGDAFAAGALLALARGADPIAAAHAGHAAAAHVIRGPGADAWVEP